MSWKSEAKEIKQERYGYYCTMCEKLKIKRVPYGDFNDEIYETTKKKFKNG